MPNRGVGIRVRDDESFEKALRRFSKLCIKTGLIADMKRHQRYEKPSEKRKRKKKAAIRRQHKLDEQNRAY